MGKRLAFRAERGDVSAMKPYPTGDYLEPVFKFLLTFGVGLLICGLL